MKRTPRTWAAACLFLLLGACVSRGTTHEPSTQAHAAPPTSAQPQAQAQANCPHDAGTRLPTIAQDCARAGRSYSEDELRDTGATNAADALRHLDPTATGD